MEALVDYVKKLAKSGDAKTRRKILDQLRSLSHSIESPDDTIQRISYLNLQLAGLRIGVDLKLFSTLTESPGPLSIDQIRAKTKADPVLLGRVLRYLASIDAIQEVDKDTFTANNMSKTFATTGAEAAIHHYFDAMGPGFQELPDLLKDTQYADPEDSTNTGIQRAWKTDLPLFLWFQEQPEKLSYFQHYLLTMNRSGRANFLDAYPVLEKTTTNLDPERALFVDVGGGYGTQSIAFREKYPDLPGKVIMEDLPETVKQLARHPGVEALAQDFFQPQIIKGAKFYYMRNIMHDWPDDKCRLILKHLIDAMEPDSYILLDEMVLPNSGVHWQQAQLDMLMMAVLAARERTHEQWSKLLDSVGLKINNIYTYNDTLQDGIIEAVRV